jgi:mannose-6-phosphate isomerase-like protein (cupin superfamily)
MPSDNPPPDTTPPPPGPLAKRRIADLPGDPTAREFLGHHHGDVPISLILIDHAPGDGPALHLHDYDEVIIVIEGEMTVTDGTTTVVVTAGEIAIAPARRPHAFTNTGTGRLRSIDIHTNNSFATQWLPAVNTDLAAACAVRTENT